MSFVLESGKDLQSVASRGWHLAFIKYGVYLTVLGVGDQEDESWTPRGNVQGVVCEGTPERERGEAGTCRNRLSQVCRQTYTKYKSPPFSLSLLKPCSHKCTLLPLFTLLLMDSLRSAFQGGFRPHFSYLKPFSASFVWIFRTQLVAAFSIPQSI